MTGFYHSSRDAEIEFFLKQLEEALPEYSSVEGFHGSMSVAVVSSKDYISDVAAELESAPSDRPKIVVLANEGTITQKEFEAFVKAAAEIGAVAFFTNRFGNASLILGNISDLRDSIAESKIKSPFETLPRLAKESDAAANRAIRESLHNAGV